MTPPAADFTPLSLRLDPKLVVRVDALCAKLVAPGMPRAKRSDVLRVVVERGLEVLEAGHKRPPAKRR